MTIRWGKWDIEMNIIYSKRAAKSINKINNPFKQNIKEAIEHLPTGDVKKLQGYKNTYRLRVGNYRILFIWIIKSKLLMSFQEVQHIKNGGIIMTATRQQLRDMIDIVDAKELNILYYILCKFISESAPMPDEIEAIRLGRDEIRRGETVSHDEIDWR